MSLANGEITMLIKDYNKRTRYCTKCCVEINKGSFTRHLNSQGHLKNMKNNGIPDSRVGKFQYKCECNPNRLLNIKYRSVHNKGIKHALYMKYLDK